MYELTLYLNTPANRWSRKPPAHETLYTQQFPRLWLAKWKARSLYGQLIPGRAAWFVSHKGVVVAEYAEQVEAPADSSPVAVEVLDAETLTRKAKGRILNWPSRLK